MKNEVRSQESGARSQESEARRRNLEGRAKIQASSQPAANRKSTQNNKKLQVMSTHTGKIGRLPEAIREQLNQRLAGGEEEEEDGAEKFKHLSELLAADFAVFARKRMAAVTEPAEGCTLIQGFLETLHHLRREEHRAERLRLERARHDYEVRKDEDELERRKEREEKIQQMFSMAPPS